MRAFATSSFAAAVFVLAAIFGISLAAPLRHAQEALLSDSFARRLIALSDSDRRWLSENQIFELYRQGIKFIDVTEGDYDLLETRASVSANKAEPESLKKFPTELVYQKQVNPILETISKQDMIDFLTTFTTFRTRYFRSRTGFESAQWLFDRVQDLVNTHGRENVTLSVSKFKHSWRQFSVIARFEAADIGAGKSDDDLGIVIISAHEDSVNQMNPWYGRSPGADDDGSGSTTIFEAMTRLVKSDFVPRRPIEFHWYSAEEGGLLGSQKVVAAYTEEGVNVYSVYHSDMTGVPPANKDRVIGIVADNVNRKLMQFVQLVAGEYCTVPWVSTKCGYACSDHATWTKAGVPAAMAFESTFDEHTPYIHTEEDSVDKINFDHVADFVRLAIGVSVELSLSKN